MQFLKILSAVVWGAVGVFFGLGLVLAGAQNLSSPGGVLVLILGVSLASAAFAAHRATCWLLSRSQRASRPI